MGSFGAELLKLRKRPSTWYLGISMVLVVLVFGYLLTYLLFSAVPAEIEQAPSQDEALAPLEGDPAEDAMPDLLGMLLPAKLLPMVLSSINQFGGPIALILGALVMGSEYGWGTLKTVLLQRPGRTSIVVAKLLAVSLVLVVFAALAFTVGASSSSVIAWVEGGVVNWPAAAEVARALGAATVILGAWAALGIFLATLFRGTSLAIGLGLVYALVLEGLVSNLLTREDATENVQKLLLGQNSNSLAGAFGSVSQALGAAPPPVEPVQAALMLGAYAIVFLLLTVLLFKGRDVT